MWRRFSYFFRFKPNRRQFPRARARNLIKELNGPASSNPSIYNLVDISEGGLKMTSAEPVTRGRTVRLAINLAHSDRQIFTSGEVVWSRPVRSKRVFCQAGVNFHSMTNDDRAFIKNYVEWQNDLPWSATPLLCF